MTEKRHYKINGYFYNFHLAKFKILLITNCKKNYS